MNVEKEIVELLGGLTDLAAQVGQLAANLTTAIAALAVIDARIKRLEEEVKHTSFLNIGKN